MVSISPAFAKLSALPSSAIAARDTADSAFGALDLAF